MTFNQDGISNDQVLRSLRAMIIEGGFKADSIIIDGFDFIRTDKKSIAAFKDFATELGISIWYSCSVKDEVNQYDKENVPLMLSGFTDNIDVIIVLQPKPDHVELSISKDRNSVVSKSKTMKLDPRTLLILEA